MATSVISPGLGVLSDDEESPVFESTAADCAEGIRKELLGEFSVISPGLGHPSQVNVNIYCLTPTNVLSCLG